MLAVDRAPDGLAYAATKFADRGVTNIELVEADVASYVPEQPVDAVLGRLVLSYLPDPVATIRRLLGALNQGGVYLALEYDTDAVRSAPPTPTVTQAAGLDERRVRRRRDPADDRPAPARGDPRGRRCARTHRVLGLQAVRSTRMTRSHRAMLAARDPAAWLPRSPKHGIADLASLEVATLRRPDRGRAEGGRIAMVVLPTLVAAWGHPG